MQPALYIVAGEDTHQGASMTCAAKKTFCRIVISIIKHSQKNYQSVKTQKRVTYQSVFEHHALKLHSGLIYVGLQVNGQLHTLQGK